jgi:hypothetical protein
MKNITTLTLAVVAVLTILYAGFYGMAHNQATGAFFAFIGGCTAIGLAMDISNHVKARIRRSNLRKLGGS